MKSEEIAKIKDSLRDIKIYANETRIDLLGVFVFCVTLWIFSIVIFLHRTNAKISALEAKISALEAKNNAKNN